MKLVTFKLLTLFLFKVQLSGLSMLINKMLTTIIILISIHLSSTKTQQLWKEDEALKTIKLSRIFNNN